MAGFTFGPVNHPFRGRSSAGLGRRATAEAIGTALRFVIAAVATDRRATPGFAGLAVGIAIAFDALAGGPLTGASMNPARSFGPAVAAGAWRAHGIYWLAPIGGMVAAAWTYEFLRPASAPDALRPGRAFGVAGPIEPPTG